ncbi:MAG: UDP-N-acetylmuramoyl-L-alanyl-D-glutamate--2,6-diaminopimelate ligase [Oscillospiraceae bacterium]|jgi:UDP-N-acetylmuramoyl-L-alanyl-D-glutamate--2,6-diaminopimelate ligase|nr:UDP-N-acetylmuramoyl-L-alanyl-D-glutamate--2,6-diaminopimelate ligase [Oscillospiraceae bacterium]
MKLGELLHNIPILETNADLEQEITGVSYDSRHTSPGDLFIALEGYETDGHRFIPMAREKGAACVLCQKTPQDGGPYVRTGDSRGALAQTGRNWFGDPAGEMTMVGVTGTNGKTTTTYLLKDVLEKAAGAKVGLIGTNQNMVGDEVLHTERTTPESFELQALFRRMADAGCTHVVMEVSSHALCLQRVAGIRFAAGLFTNLSQDHLDFHGSMEDYCGAKALLFRQCEKGVYNADDPWADRVTRDAPCPLSSFGEKAGELRGENIRLAVDGVDFDACRDGETVPVRVNIPGGFTVYNALGVMAAARELGVPLADSARVLRQSAGVKGRVEVVPVPGEYTVLIDYAVTPDAIENVLATVRDFAKGRVVILFGCGGDRDRGKRPKMGRIAARMADFVVVTSDNPRTEVPGDIIADILPGLEGTETPYVVVEDRVEAIRYALDHARKDDVIILAGKGHETYQIVGHEKRHLDEREVVAAYIAEHKERA